jgi:protein gp37
VSGARLFYGDDVENSKIGWTKNTFNGWMGCTKVSPACDNCYAERDMDHRFGRVCWGAGQPRVRTSEKNWRKPLQWNREAEKSGEKIKVFCSSLSDVFDGEKVSDLDAWRTDLWKLIEDTPNLYWLLLTKRPQNIRRMVPTRWMISWPEHVWIGASAETQSLLDYRARILSQIPARVRFLSCEPLLEPLDFSRWLGTHDCHRCNKRFWGDDFRVRDYNEGLKIVDFTERGKDGEDEPTETCPYCGYANTDGDDHTVGRNIDLARAVNWVIVGGESGPGWREMNMDWVRSIRDQCVAANVPFFLKQTAGARPVKEPVLDGRQWIECPEERFALGV